MADPQDIANILSRWDEKPLRDPVLDLPSRDPWWVPPRAPAEARSYNPHRPADAMAPVAEMISPTMGAYGAASLGTEAILDAYRGKYNPETLAPLAAAALPVPGARRAPLAMDEASRMARARARRGDIDQTFHHGTTHEFEAFADPNKPGHEDRYHPENYHGRAIYASSSPSDARGNYAGVDGPDMRAKLDHLADQIGGSGYPDDPHTAMVAKRLIDEGIMPAHYASDPNNANTFAAAYQRLIGARPEGRTLDLRLNPHNPVIIGGPRETNFGYNLPDYSIKEVPGGHVVLDPEGHPVYSGKAGIMDEHAAYDLLDELRYQGVGAGAKLLEELQKLTQGQHRFAQEAGDKLVGQVHEHMMDNEGIRAKEFEKLYRQSDFPLAMMEMGERSQGPDVLYRALGHDAVIMNNAEKVFPGMRLAPDTTHAALFDPRRVRSVDAAFDPKRINSRNLLAGGAGAAVLPGVILDETYGRD